MEKSDETQSYFILSNVETQLFSFIFWESWVRGGLKKNSFHLQNIICAKCVHRFRDLFTISVVL